MAKQKYYVVWEGVRPEFIHHGQIVRLRLMDIRMLNINHMSPVRRQKLLWKAVGRNFGVKEAPLHRLPQQNR